MRAQGLESDAAGNIWIPSFANDSAYVFIDGNPQRAAVFQRDVGSGPFDVAIAADGTAWVSNGLGKPPSTVAKYALVNGGLQQQFRYPVGQGLRGLSVDSRGDAWVASQGDSLVYALRPGGTEIGHYGGGIDGPWDTAIDGENNVWVANFGPHQVGTGNVFTGRLSKLCGIRGNCPPGKVPGDPISPPTGFTVPSAGDEVLLHDGDPLYGHGTPPSYIPMMRQTGVAIDQAGNIWSINNWKPRFDNDALLNPGGTASSSSSDSRRRRRERGDGSPQALRQFIDARPPPAADARSARCRPARSGRAATRGNARASRHRRVEVDRLESSAASTAR